MDSVCRACRPSAAHCSLGPRPTYSLRVIDLASRGQSATAEYLFLFIVIVRSVVYLGIIKETDFVILVLIVSLLFYVALCTCVFCSNPVSYTHLTLPTNREV